MRQRYTTTAAVLMLSTTALPLQSGTLMPTTVTPEESVIYPAPVPQNSSEITLTPVPLNQTPELQPLQPQTPLPTINDVMGGVVEESLIAEQMIDSEQMLITSTRQWSAIAKRAASDILAAIDPEVDPVYLEPVDGASPPFLHAYQDFLIAHLVDQGGIVASNSRSVATIKIAYASQIVVHKNGCCTPPEVTEVVITTRLVKGRRILMSSSRPFQFYLNDSSMYINDVEAFMVENNLTPNRRYGVSR
ncbi:hypothetical protein D5085_07065 [Ectothiorhodospiraceae bacterium BW-2]|nr:hypothetical protein D5085_07065 [Ectothiorhodospiraceae bacterium BW-2]